MIRSCVCFSSLVHCGSVGFIDLENTSWHRRLSAVLFWCSFFSFAYPLGCHWNLGLSLSLSFGGAGWTREFRLLHTSTDSMSVQVKWANHGAITFRIALLCFSTSAKYTTLLSKNCIGMHVGLDWIITLAFFGLVLIHRVSIWALLLSGGFGYSDPKREIFATSVYHVFFLRLILFSWLGWNGCVELGWSWSISLSYILCALPYTTYILSLPMGLELINTQFASPRVVPEIYVQNLHP